jgi:hypothetical protein
LKLRGIDRCLKALRTKEKISRKKEKNLHRMLEKATDNKYFQRKETSSPKQIPDNKITQAQLPKRTSYLS